MRNGTVGRLKLKRQICDGGKGWLGRETSKLCESCCQLSSWIMNSTFICQTIYLFYRCSSTPINFHVIGVDKRIKCPGTRTYRTYPLWSMQDECLALVVHCGNIHIDVQIERILLVWLSVYFPGNVSVLFVPLFNGDIIKKLVLQLHMKNQLDCMPSRRHFHPPWICMSNTIGRGANKSHQLPRLADLSEQWKI